MEQKQEELGPEYDPVLTGNGGEDPGGSLEESGRLEETEGKRKEAFCFSGGGPASQSEAKQQVRRRRVDQWSPGNRQRNV